MNTNNPRRFLQVFVNSRWPPNCLFISTPEIFRQINTANRIAIFSKNPLMKINCKTEIARILFATYLFGNQILFGIFEMKLSSFQLAISKTRHAIKTKAARLDVEKMPSALNSSENHPLSDATSWKNVRLSNNKV